MKGQAGIGRGDFVAATYLEEIRMSCELPRLHLNFAVQPSPDGPLYFGPGTSCAADLQRCHHLREIYAAVMVSGRTFRQERPQLTARREHLGREPLGQPARIVITRAGVPDLPDSVIELRLPDGAIESGLARLAARGIHSILVEGGPTLHRDLLKRQLFGSATIYIHGSRPEAALPQLYDLLLGLPRAYRIRPLGEGHLLQFDFMGREGHLPNETLCNLPSEFGLFRLHAFEDPEKGMEHAALVLGEPAGLCHSVRPPLVRIHSSCWTGDLFGSRRCDCGEQLRAALNALQAEGNGVLLYLNQEGRGIGLRAKAEAYTLQDQGFDTYAANTMLHLPAEGREFGFRLTF
jgi:GTP cyclohydrolase II